MTAPAHPKLKLSLADATALMTAPGARFEMEEVEIWGAKQRVWKNAPPTIRDNLLQGRQYADREFLQYEDDKASFADFEKACVAVAYALIEAGVKKGDRVAVIMRNYPEWPVAFYGAAITGAIVTPLNAWWTGPELEYGLKDSGAKIAIVDGERAARLVDHAGNLPDLQEVWVVRPEGDELTAMAALPGGKLFNDVTGPVNDWKNLPARELPDVPLEPEDPATIFYTSGTTGKPKGALGSHRNFTTCIFAGGFSAARAFVQRGEVPPTPGPDQPQRRALISVPFFHVTGCEAWLAGAIAAGSFLVMLRRWDPVECMKLVEKLKLTSIGGVPTIPWQVLEHPDREKYDLSTLNHITYGGAPSSPGLVRRINEFAPEAIIGEGWGMTETSATFTSVQSEEYIAHPDSCGPPVPVCDVRIVDEDGNDLPVGGVGEVWAKGPNVVKEYWNKPEATAETFVDGWIKTGDVGRVDDEGRLYLVDRAKDMIIRGGENIYCVEVEDVLYDHPAIMDAAIVPIPDKTLGELPAAVVTLKPGKTATEEEVIEHVKSRLAKFKAPVKVVFQTETLPRNPNGKIMKAELKKLFSAGEQA
ncbi:MAG: class I adenylate-forming enzyme family protein [Maricaulaceae bacterium]|jgi:long-chain acyl-CoA synthetase